MNWFEREWLGRPAYELDSVPVLTFLIGTVFMYGGNPILWMFFWGLTLKYGFEDWPE